LLKTVNTAYSSSSSDNLVGGFANVVPTQIQTVWPNGKISQITKSYDCGFSYISVVGNVKPNGIYGKVLSKSDYDYGQGAAGPLLRTTKTNYLALSNSTYLTNNLLDSVSSQQVLDSGGTQRAYTTYAYDEYSLN